MILLDRKLEDQWRKRKAGGLKGLNDKCKEGLTNEKLTAASDEGRVMLFSEEAF